MPKVGPRRTESLWFKKNIVDEEDLLNQEEEEWQAMLQRVARAGADRKPLGDALEEEGEDADADDDVEPDSDDDMGSDL